MKKVLHISNIVCTFVMLSAAKLKHKTFKKMKNVTITSQDDFVTPVLVQSAIKDRFAFSKNKEVEVKFDSKEKTFDVYQNDKFVCSFDSDGNKI